MGKLGLIAGGGGLPVEIARHCQATGRPLFVARLKGFAGPDLAEFPGTDVGIAQLGQCIAAFRNAGVETVCMAGIVAKPDFAALRPDLRGLKALPRVAAAALKGDDALLRALVAEFEAEGFGVQGAHEAMDNLTLPLGPLGRVRPSAIDLEDARLALEAARAVGLTDLAQGAVVRAGVVLATEAEDGTDAMLARLEAGRGGVLAKAPKPRQDLRVDLPTIGVATLRGAARAGLSGVVGEAGRMLVLDRPAVAALADELGLFVLGVEP